MNYKKTFNFQICSCVASAGFWAVLAKRVPLHGRGRNLSPLRPRGQQTGLCRARKWSHFRKIVLLNLNSSWRYVNLKWRATQRLFKTIVGSFFCGTFVPFRFWIIFSNCKITFFFFYLYVQTVIAGVHTFRGFQPYAACQRLPRSSGNNKLSFVKIYNLGIICTNWNWSNMWFHLEWLATQRLFKTVPSRIIIFAVHLYHFDFE